MTRHSLLMAVEKFCPVLSMRNSYTIGWGYDPDVMRCVWRQSKAVNILKTKNIIENYDFILFFYIQRQKNCHTQLWTWRQRCHLGLGLRWRCATAAEKRVASAQTAKIEIITKKYCKKKNVKTQALFVNNNNV